MLFRSELGLNPKKAKRAGLLHDIGKAVSYTHLGGMEDFMTLIRVYYQSVMACNIGITNINFLPDMAVFKRTLTIPTQNNKLGIAEQSRCNKMLVELYGLSDDFFKEIDGSIKKNCQNVNDVKTCLLYTSRCV